MNDLIHDIETYPNIFTMSALDVVDNLMWRFEISHRVNHGVALFQFLTSGKYRFVGFNSLGFDCPVLTELVKRGGHVTCMDLYNKAQAIIDTDFNDRFKHMVYESDWFAPQIDLFKIHHFDNVARSTSLKMLEFNMRSDNIQDLPYKPGSYLTEPEMDNLIIYNDADVFETRKFYDISNPMIEFREELSIKYDRNFMNHNDTKIGKDFFIMELEKNGVQCFDGREPRQTRRRSIALADVILPMVKFTHPEFNRIKRHFENQVIIETKGVFKDVDCTINGFKYVFGLGGIHGSVESTVAYTDSTHQIIDIDVKSYYPHIAIANGIHPEHLGQVFCDIYAVLYSQRSRHDKKTAINAILKLALNGVYGDSNNKYSPFYDPQYTMAITINGQLLLCMLAEFVGTIPGLTMIQINTDGLTVRCPHLQIDTLMMITKMWEDITNLELERVDYSRMFIRDVNNYVAEEMDGKVKRKGAYCYGKDLGWHQNHSCQIVAKAAVDELIHGIPLEETIAHHTDPHDFMLRTKVPRSSRLELDGKVQQNITRYYISHSGGTLTKIMPPTPTQRADWAASPRHMYVNQSTKDSVFIKSTDSYSSLVKKGYSYAGECNDAPERQIGISVGWQVIACNNITDYDPSQLNREYYISEARKLVNPLAG